MLLELGRETVRRADSNMFGTREIVLFPRCPRLDVAR
jgi:hypothetical protein